MGLKINLKAIVNILGLLIVFLVILYGYSFIKSLDSRFISNSNYNYSPVTLNIGDSMIIYNSPPIHLDIDSIDLSIDVVPGYYNQSRQSWTVSDDKANFATISSVPNPRYGNTYIYGHNRTSIFSSLVRLSEGDEAVVISSDEKKFIYKLETIKDVSQYDTSYLENSDRSILTLQTCSGFWDQYRTLYVFNYIGEK